MVIPLNTISIPISILIDLYVPWLLELSVCLYVCVNQLPVNKQKSGQDAHKFNYVPSRVVVALTFLKILLTNEKNEFS